MLMRIIYPAMVWLIGEGMSAVALDSVCVDHTVDGQVLRPILS
jgi:hypothetical protein